MPRLIHSINDATLVRGAQTPKQQAHAPALEAFSPTLILKHEKDPDLSLFN